MKKVIRLTEQDLQSIVIETVNKFLKEGSKDFEAAKYNGKWSVFDKKSRTFSHIGVGKKKASEKANELNDYCSEKDKVNESVFYGDTKPFEMILKAASKIRKRYEYTANEDYEPWDDSDGRDLAPEIYRWAKRVEDEAENWLMYSSERAPINGGENW